MAEGDLGHDWTGNGFDLITDSQFVRDETNYLLGNASGYLNAVEPSGVVRAQAYHASAGLKSAVVDGSGYINAHTITGWCRITGINSTGTMGFNFSVSDSAVQLIGNMCGYTNNSSGDSWRNFIHVEFATAAPFADLATGTLEADGNFHFFASSVSKSSATAGAVVFRIDGSAASSFNFTAIVTANADGIFKIGCWNTAASRDNMAGQYDQVCLWNKALSTAELNSLYNSGSGRDLTGSELSNDLHAAWLFDTAGGGGRRDAVLNGVGRGVGRGMRHHNEFGSEIHKPTLRETIIVNGGN